MSAIGDTFELHFVAVLDSAANAVLAAGTTTVDDRRPRHIFVGTLGQPMTKVPGNIIFDGELRPKGEPQPAIGGRVVTDDHAHRLQFTGHPGDPARQGAYEYPTLDPTTLHAVYDSVTETLTLEPRA